MKTTYVSEQLPFCAACNELDFICNATISNPGGHFFSFYLQTTVSKNLKPKALSIISFLVSPHTVVVATKKSKSLGKDIVATQTTAKKIKNK